MLSYQKVTGSLMANSHPGSYCGQDAYNNMLVTENDLYNSKTGLSHKGAVGCSICTDGIGLQRSTNDNKMWGGDEINATSRNKELCLLWKTYGEEKVLQWGTAIMERIQQAEILQQGMYESCVQREAKTWDKLDDGSLPCPKLVTQWLLRDMREQQERGCSSQGRKSAKQLDGEPAEGLPELPYKNPSSCADLFDMWKKGEGIGLLRQTLSEIQKIRRSSNSEWKGGDGMNGEKTVVRRLTPL